MRLTTLFVFLVLPFTAPAQEGETPLGKYKINRNICLRGELGWNRSWFGSLGASYVYSNVNSHALLSIVLYAAAETGYAGYHNPHGFY